MLLNALRNLFNVNLLRRNVKLGLCSVRNPKPKATPKNPNDVYLQQVLANLALKLNLN